KAETGATRNKVEEAKARLEAERDQAMAPLKEQITSARSRHFLRDAAVTPLASAGSDQAVSIKGLGPALAGSTKSMNWEIEIHLGQADKFAADFGRALAENNITMLNGHFYPGDAQAAESETSGVAQQNWRRPIQSEIYGP